MKIIQLVLTFIWFWFINFIGRPIAYFLILMKFGPVKYVNSRISLFKNGPYVVIANHTNHWDPFLVTAATSVPIRWIASDAAFRDSLKPVLYAVGAIPKIKETSDMVTMKMIGNAVAMKQVIGIFAEGKQTWDGKTMELITSTAKLIRFLKIPVVSATIKGGFLAKPRWSWKARKHKITIEFNEIISRKEIKTMKLSEILKRMKDALDFDDFEWQKQHKYPVKSNIRAEYIELALYTCPKCEKIGNLHSSGNFLQCSCGFQAEIDKYGFIVCPDNPPDFNSMHEWMLWQDKKLTDSFDIPIKNNDTAAVLLSDKNVTLKKGSRAKAMDTLITGDAKLYIDRIEVSENGKIFVFPLAETSAGSVFKQYYFDFRYNKTQYQFVFADRHTSGYKWEVAWKKLKNI